MLGLVYWKHDITQQMLMKNGQVKYFLIGLLHFEENIEAIKVCNWETEPVMPSTYFWDPCLTGFIQF